ncbi:MAG: phosphorylase [Bacteroidetes bacterium]|nr:MAG: phosphorylase [Bacteroidota bacterium]TAG95338.1 MAG: phosphorylase [Bacteroidota bacterium]
MNPLANTELILNADKSVYHLHLRPEHIAETIFLVGDPDRVKEVSSYFDTIEYQIQHREFVTHTGYLGKKRLSVISSGIGTDNVEILLTELDALVNIDLDTRQIKSDLTSLRMIRLGTSGILRPEIEVGTILMTEFAIGLDNLMYFYQQNQTKKEKEIAQSINEYFSLGFMPSCTQAHEKWFEQWQQKTNFIKGNTLTCPGFYAPQGRELRIKNTFQNLKEKYYSFDYQGFKLTNLEMETAGYYAFGRLFGHQIISINALLANRYTGQFAENPSQIVKNMIEIVLDKI